MPDRVIVYIDAQNTYKQARAAFSQPSASHVEGQIDPLTLGKLLVVRGPQDADRTLFEVRVYTGRPDPNREPRANAAHMRQCAVWSSGGVTVVPRPLQYLPGQRPREKGVDVHLAVDLVRGALDNQYDIAIVMSSDTDLYPAIELVASRYPVFPRIETAAWRGRGGLTRAGNRSIWCHFLDRSDYDLVHDSRDYNQ